MKSQHSVIVVPGHKISDWYDRAAERCEFVMIELGSTLVWADLSVGYEQFLKLPGRPTLYARYGEGVRENLADEASRPFHVPVMEQWEGQEFKGAAIVETPKGVRNLSRSQQVPQELWFGPMDYCASAKLPWRDHRSKLEEHAIASVSNAAKALGIPFVAGPCFTAGNCCSEAVEDFMEFGADRKGAINLQQVDQIETAWEYAQGRRPTYTGSGVAWEKGVLVGPVLR